MRSLFFTGCALLVALAWACTDVPSAPETGLMEIDPLFSHHAVPGRCFSTQTAVAPHEEETAQDPLLTTQAEFDAAYDADANGNGWVCLNLVETSPGVHQLPPPGERTDFDDDFASCSEGTAEFRPGDPADENGNGFVCVAANGDVLGDDSTSTGGQVPGPIPVEEVECQDGFTPAEVEEFGREDADENDNGWVCFRLSLSGVEVVDDLAEAGPQGMTLTEGKVRGHGVYDVGGRTLSFSFHGLSDGESVKGNFEFHDRDTGARYHGDVTCMEVDGTTALLEGRITNDKEGGPGDGVAVAWTAVDNGEGKKAPDDEVSDPQAFGPWTEACGVRPSDPTRPISGGNVQVK